MKPRVIIRVDASVAIGTGHVTRMVSLARTLDADVTFVCRLHEGNLCDWLARDFSVVRLEAGRGGSGYAGWLGVTEEEDARDTLKAIGSCDALVVDHYGLGREWETKMRAGAKRILAIDDLANREHDCDILLDQNLRADNPYEALCPPRCELLLGPRYALLAPDFAAAAGTAGKGSAIHVFFGGSDLTGETSKALRAVKLLSRPAVPFRVLVGQNNPRREEIRSLAAGIPNVTLIDRMLSTQEMITELAGARFALGAGGTTSWERACLGLPSLVISVAENQVPGAVAMARAGQHVYLGEHSQVTESGLAKALAHALDHPEELARLRERNLALVDGRGARRAASRLLPPVVALRLAEPADCDLIHGWRNAPETRRQSFDSAEIPLESHRRWYAAALQDKAKILLVAPGMGVLRYDLAGDSATVSIYLAPEQQGRGLGPAILRAGTDWLRDRHGGVKEIHAEVKEDNIASRKAFLAAGYVAAGDGFTRKMGDK